MTSYVFEFDTERRGSHCVGGRVYKSDATAIAAARRYYINRHTDMNDELTIWEGRVNGWGDAEGRIVGKICYDCLGLGPRFVTVEPLPEN